MIPPDVLEAHLDTIWKSAVSGAISRGIQFAALGVPMKLLATRARALVQMLREGRMLALDRADRAETALALLANVRPLGAFRRRVAVRLAKVIAEEGMRGEGSPRASGAGGPRSSEVMTVDDKTKGLLSRVVRYGRLRRRLTQQQVAERLGVKQPNVAKLESGKPLREETVERFAAAVGSTFEAIVLEYLDAKRAGLVEQVGALEDEARLEEYEPPGPSRERQLRRLYAALGDVAAVGRVVGVSRQGVADQLLRYGIRT